MNLSVIARELGRRGGRARGRRLPAHERARIAALGGVARRESLDAARRILDNLRYAAVLDAVRPPHPVKSLESFRGPLPGIHGTARRSSRRRW